MSQVTSLLQSAAGQGFLSQESLGQLLGGQDVAETLNAGIGRPLEEIGGSSETFMSLVLADDSYSIEAAGNTKVLMEGVNYVFDSLKGSSQRDSILVWCGAFNRWVIFDFRPVDEAIPLDASNFTADGSTPLYDKTADTLALAIAKQEEGRRLGIPCRTATLIITDGHDEHSVHHNPTTIAPIVRDMLMSEHHIIGAMGIDDGGRTNFREVFQAMGIPEDWILTPDNSPAEIRRALNIWSSSNVQASQGAESFSEVAQAGAGWTQP